MPPTDGAHCLGIGCDHADDAPVRRASSTPLRGRHALGARRERLKPAARAGQSSRPTDSTRTTATPSSADSSRSTSAVMPQS